MRVLLLVAGLALTIYAVVDCLQTKDDRVKYLPKIAWFVLIVLIPWARADRLAARRPRTLAAARPQEPEKADHRPAWPRGRPRLPA